ncbi:MAG: flagellar basal body P-ring protein FlgI [Planctomycetes bacterium]|nr:flagellar basal body P-ring protein FlgI [Planctomycetota bacterium]
MTMIRATRLVLVAASTILAMLWGCSDPPAPKSVNVTPARDVPPLLRGTVGSEVTFLGIEPVLVSGYGLVVGLSGTGGDVLPDNIAATMEREMGLMGIGKAGEYAGTPLNGKTPRQLLRDPNVAVVLVQAAIPPGSPQGARFDIYVRAINASNLEGGTLWTTDLRIGDANAFGQVQARAIAKARGPIFINPFADPGKEDNGITKTSGRVLDGGYVTNPLEIELVLNAGSFQRVRSMVSAINSRFPEGPGDPGPTSRARQGPDVQSGAGGSLVLRVPARYRRTAAEFLQLVRHVQIDQSAPEQYARRYVEGVKAEPFMADDTAWGLEALGQKAVPFARELYEYGELAPRMAGLRAGSRLNDPRAAGPLKELAKSGDGVVRTKAIELLGEIEAGPTVDEALQELLRSPELIVRVAAYEALVKRSERVQYLRLARAQRENPDPNGPRFSPTALEMLASSTFSGASMQGIERRLVEDKFLLDVVPFGDPLIYITQQGRPRIVLFGVNPTLARPAVVSAWEDRLMIVTEAGDDEVRLYYRPLNADKPITMHGKGKARLSELVTFLARKGEQDAPRVGLSLSYSEVVGVLYAAFKEGATEALFTTETDRLKAQLLAATSVAVPDRPETEADRELVPLKRPAVMQPQTTPKPDSPGKPEIVPILPPTDKKDPK